jgi:transcriptional regulator with XRE-family HTH domain
VSKLAGRIKKARTKEGLSVRDLAARVGVSPGYISRIEGRGEVPTAEVLCRLSDVLKIPAESLLAEAKADLLEKAKQDISQKHAEALRLFRRSK